MPLVFSYTIVSPWLSVMWATDNQSLGNTEVVEMHLAAYICSGVCFLVFSNYPAFQINSGYRPGLPLPQVLSIYHRYGFIGQWSDV